MSSSIIRKCRRVTTALARDIERSLHSRCSGLLGRRCGGGSVVVVPSHRSSRCVDGRGVDNGGRPVSTTVSSHVSAAVVGRHVSTGVADVTGAVSRLCLHCGDSAISFRQDPDVAGFLGHVIGHLGAPIGGVGQKRIWLPEAGAVAIEHQEHDHGQYFKELVHVASFRGK